VLDVVEETRALEQHAAAARAGLAELRQLVPPGAYGAGAYGGAYDGGACGGAGAYGGAYGRGSYGGASSDEAARLREELSERRGQLRRLEAEAARCVHELHDVQLQLDDAEEQHANESLLEWVLYGAA